jgi:hypothetical protein
MLRRGLAVLLFTVLTACTTVGNPPLRGGLPNPTAAPSFDLARVKANFTAECADPIAVDELFCTQVDVTGMTADGGILRVPTTLNPAAKDRASAICDTFVTVHYDGDTGQSLGYTVVGILDMNGGNAASCTVSP